MDKRKSATSLWEIADVERLAGYCSDARDGSECERAVAHAGGCSEGSQGCRKDWDDDLNDGLPSFLFHDAYCFKVSSFKIQVFKV